MKKEKGKMIEMRREEEEKEGVNEEVEKGVVGKVREWKGKWWRLEMRGVRGWIKK